MRSDDLVKLHSVGNRRIRSPEFFPLDPMVNSSWNIERGGKKMHQTAADMMLSQYLQLKLNLL